MTRGKQERQLRGSGRILRRRREMRRREEIRGNAGILRRERERKSEMVEF